MAFGITLTANAEAQNESDCNSVKTDDMIQCLVDRQVRYDTILNMRYQELSHTLSENDFIEIRDIQRLWLSVFKKSCLAEFSDNKHGNETEIYLNLCIADQINERNRELEIIDELNRGIVRSYHLSPSIDADNIKDYPRWDQYVKKHCEFMQAAFNDTQCYKRNLALHLSTTLLH